MTAFTGYLLVADESIGDITVELLEKGWYCSNKSESLLKYSGSFQDLSLWETYIFSSKYFFTEDKTPELLGPPYHYRVVCARSGRKLIVLTELRKITDHLISRLDETITPNLRKVHFCIDDLITGFSNSNSKYQTTSLRGRIKDDTRNLRTISLYGTNVIDSPVFREHHNLFNFYSCGLGYSGFPEMPYGEEREIVRLGTDGVIYLRSFEKWRVCEFQKIIKQVIRDRYVESWVPLYSGGDR